jgi:hypothetical protein
MGFNKRKMEDLVQKAARGAAISPSSSTPALGMISTIPDASGKASAQKAVNDQRLINGSPGRIRTSDQPVNSRLLYR